MKNTRRILSAILCPAFLLLGLCGCSNEPLSEPLREEADKGLCELRFDCGTLATRGGVAPLTAFTDEAQVELLVYQREHQTGNAFESPEKTYVVKGKVEANSTAITVTEVDGTATDKLSLPQGKTYDILAILNDSPKRELVNSDGSPRAIFGSWLGDYISSFRHGWSVLAGKQTVDIAAEQTTATIDFGNLPHMNTAIQTKVMLDETMFNKLKNGDGKVKAGLTSVKFNYCLPSSANLNIPTDGKTLAYNVIPGSYNTSFEMYPRMVTSEELSSAGAAYTSDMGYILPCPLKKQGVNNEYDITFNLDLNGYGTQLRANKVSLPELKGGYKYTFTVKCKDTGATQGQIDLYVSVSPWDKVSYATDEGGYGSTEYFQNIYVGSWNTVTYNTVDGAYDTDPRYLSIGSVSGWSSVAWGTIEGEYE